MAKPLPTQFENREPISDLIQDYKNYQEDIEYIWASKELDKGEMDEGFGVESSTTRAMSTGIQDPDLGPTVGYLGWAARMHTKLRSETQDTLRLRSQTEFDSWHTQLCSDLDAYWAGYLKGLAPSRTVVNATKIPLEMPTELSFAHCRKLVDLFVRNLRFRDEHVWLMESCRQWGHIPLDMKSLHVISHIFNLVDPSSRTYSMGDVETPKQYEAYQEMARVIVKVAQVGTPLLFDAFVWNHPNAVAVYADKKDEDRRQRQIDKAWKLGYWRVHLALSKEGKLRAA